MSLRFDILLRLAGVFVADSMVLDFPLGGVKSRSAASSEAIEGLYSADRRIDYLLATELAGNCRRIYVAPTMPVVDRATQEAEGEAAPAPDIESKLMNSRRGGRIARLKRLRKKSINNQKANLRG